MERQIRQCVSELGAIICYGAERSSLSRMRVISKVEEL